MAAISGILGKRTRDAEETNDLPPAKKQKTDALSATFFSTLPPNMREALESHPELFERPAPRQPQEFVLARLASPPRIGAEDDAPTPSPHLYAPAPSPHLDAPLENRELSTDGKSIIENILAQEEPDLDVFLFEGLLTQYSCDLHVNRARPILEEWIQDSPPEEKASREQATSTIIDFLKDPESTCLNLEPQEEPSLLDRDNGVSSLPEGIFELAPFATRLKTLMLDYNQLSTLPEGISALNKLVELSMRFNRLRTLPEGIQTLDSLQDLNLSDNSIENLSEEVCAMTNLKFLILDHNLMTMLPRAIGGLMNLETLTLDNMTIPVEIPDEIFQLPRTCTVYIERTSLPSHILARINAPGYAGPRFQESEPDDDESIEAEETEQPIEVSLQTLFEFLQEEKRDFPALTEVTEENAEDLKHLSQWLARLSLTAEHKKGEESRTSFLRKILTYLDTAEHDPLFRKTFFTTIPEGLTKCGDRMALSVLLLGTKHKIATCDLTNLSKLASLFLKGEWALNQLEMIAWEKIERLREKYRNMIPPREFKEDIEVYLAFVLQSGLDLEIDITAMLHPRCGEVTREELEAAQKSVTAQLNDTPACCEFLIKCAEWKEALKLRYPSECLEIEESKRKKLEEIDPDYVQIEEEDKKAWMDLSRRALEGK